MEEPKGTRKILQMEGKTITKTQRQGPAWWYTYVCMEGAVVNSLELLGYKGVSRHWSEIRLKK